MTIKGREALAIRKDLQSPHAGEVTPEKMAEGLKSYQKNLEIYGDFYGDFPAMYTTRKFSLGRRL